MTNESALLDNLIGKVKSYGVDLPASFNDAGEKIIYLICANHISLEVSMDSLMKHKIFTTFSDKSRLQIKHWYNE